MGKRGMNEDDRIKKAHEQAICDKFMDLITELGGPAFSPVPHAMQSPDCIYENGELSVKVEHTSAQYDVDHRKFIESPVRGTKYPDDAWPPMKKGETPKPMRNVHEVMATSIIDAIRKKCDKAKMGHYSPDTILLVEALPGLTAAENLKEILTRRQDDVPDMPFAGVYVVGRFPFTTGSVGGFRVLPIKETSLTLNLPRRKEMEPAPHQISNEEEEAAFNEGFNTTLI